MGAQGRHQRDAGGGQQPEQRGDRKKGGDGKDERESGGSDEAGGSAGGTTWLLRRGRQLDGAGIDVQLEHDDEEVGVVFEEKGGGSGRPRDARGPEPRRTSDSSLISQRLGHGPLSAANRWSAPTAPQIVSSGDRLQRRHPTRCLSPLLPGDEATLDVADQAS